MNKNVLITTSPYTTLLYFLVNDLKDIQDTAYFFVRGRKWTEQEVNRTKNVLPQSYFLNEKPITARFRRYALLQRLYTAAQLATNRAVPCLLLRAAKNFRWPFLKTAQIFCYDDYSTAKALIGKREYTFLEEGLFTYENADTYAYSKSFTLKLQRFLYAPFSVRGLGTSPQAVRIILTGLAEIPKCYNGRNLEVVSMPELWSKSEPQKKSIIMKFFDLTPDDIAALKQKDIIVVEQPLADDGLITRDEQTEMMRRIIQRYGASRVLLKTHYRSSINYRELFPDVLVWDKMTPMELLSLCGVRFSEAVTVNSTAALSFPEDVKIVWLGRSPEDSCFSHFGAASRRLFDAFVNRIPLPDRVKVQDEKEHSEC